MNLKLPIMMTLLASFAGVTAEKTIYEHILNKRRKVRKQFGDMQTEFSKKHYSVALSEKESYDLYSLYARDRIYFEFLNCLGNFHTNSKRLTKSEEEYAQNCIKHMSDQMEKEFALDHLLKETFNIGKEILKELESEIAMPEQSHNEWVPERGYYEKN